MILQEFVLIFEANSCIFKGDFSSNGYYTQMAAGWLLAECFVTFPLDTWRYLKDKKNMKLDNVSYKKAIRKICESLTPDDEVKKVVRELA